MPGGLWGSFLYQQPNPCDMAPPLEPLTYKEVTEIIRKEQRVQELVEIRRDFYPAFREFLERLKKESEEEIRKDPLSFKASSLSNEYKKINTKGSQIFIARTRKILNMTSKTLLGGKVDLARLTPEERDMYEQVLRSINDFSDHAMEGKVPSLPVPPVGSACAAVDQGQLRQALNLVNGHSAAESVETPKAADRVLVRVLEDLPEIAGMDRAYRLNKNDVANLPTPIGCALIKRGKAEEIVPFWRNTA